VQRVVVDANVFLSTAIVAVAASKRYDAIATFDQKLGKRAKDLGVATYW